MEQLWFVEPRCCDTVRVLVLFICGIFVTSQRARARQVVDKDNFLESRCENEFGTAALKRVTGAKILQHISKLMFFPPF